MSQERPHPGPFQSTLFRRLFLAVATLALLPLGVTGLGAMLSARRDADDEARVRLRSDAALAREASRAVIATRDRGACDALAKRLGRDSQARVTLLDGDGNVLGDSDHDPSTMENHAGRPEVDEARRTGSGSATRRSDTLQRDLVYYAVRADDADPSSGIVRVALPVTGLEERFRATQLRIGIVVVPVAVLAVVALGFAILVMVRAVGEVTRAAHVVASGGRLAPLAAAGRADEIGDLARSVTEMGEELERRIETIGHERNEVATIVAAMAEGLIAVDEGARILLSNESASRMLGRTSPLPVGQAAALVIPQEGIVGILREALSTRVAVARTIEVQTSGLARQVEARATPLPDASGAVLVLRDVTEETRYDRLRREFVANVSHELRTPLALVKGFLETLEDGALNDPEKGPRFLGIASRHVEALSRLVDDLLTLGALDAGAETRPPGPVSLADAVDAVFAGFEELTARKGITLTQSVEPGLPPALGHRDHIERAVRNLIDNAVKYTPDKGAIAVVVGRAQDQLFVEVADTGVGIPREDLGRIFERFYRVEKSRSREAGGTGLGLAIVKHIAQQENGSVSVESEVGKGSRFRLTFRIAPQG